MTDVFEIRVSDVGAEASAALEDLLKARYGNRQIVEYAYGDANGWEEIADGGWDLLGASEAAGGAGLGIRDLIALAKGVGQWLPPLPLLETTMTKRWSAAARESGGAVTVSVATESGRVLMPFGSAEGIGLLLDTSSGMIGPPSIVGEDEHAPALRIAEVAAATTFSPQHAREMAIVWAASAAGAAERTLDIAVDYVKQRQQFGQPLGRFQAVKHHLADALRLSQEAESAVIWAAADAPKIAPALELAFDSALRTVEICVQVHGGMGFTWELGLHVYLRQIVTLRHLALGLAACADRDELSDVMTTCGCPRSVSAAFATPIRPQ